MVERPEEVGAPDFPPVVGRLAPSPTGLLHLGHAFSLLVAWWQARRAGGQVILRLDDIDSERAKPKFFEAAVFDLKWLGIDWDGVEHVASNRTEAHKAAIRQLLELGYLYPCTCSRADVLRALGAPQQGRGEYRYPGTCRFRLGRGLKALGDHPDPHSLRFACKKGVFAVDDLIFGHFEEDVEATTGDFVVERGSGAPAYQLSVVVDDHMDSISHVIRGRDLLSSTVRQMMLARALGWASPQYAHVPLICDHLGRRLAKRDEDLSLATLRERGISSAQIVTWAARVARQFEGVSLVNARDIATRFRLDALGTQDVSLPQRMEDALQPGAPVVRI